MLYAYQALKKFDEGTPSIDPFIEKIYERNLPRRDLALAIELTIGVVRWLKKIDFILSTFSKKSLESLDSPVKAALRLGTYQIYFLDRIPLSAATNESVELVKKDLGLSGASFVNAILRRVSRSKGKVFLPDKESDEFQWLSIHYSHPKWMIRRWMKRFGKEETEEILKANNEHPPVSLWINTQLFSITSVMEKLGREGIAMIPSPYLENGFIIKSGYPYQTKIFKEGGLYIQDEASQLIPSLFGKGLSGIAADVCSAPGGKGIKMVHDAHDQLFVVGVDISSSRLNILVENLNRMKIKNFAPVTADMEGKSPLKDKFDFILVDAPCSGTGIIRRNPEIKWRLKQENIKTFHARQLAILADARNAVKKGGFLLYSVCSIEEEENEHVVRSFLHSSPHFQLEHPACRMSQKTQKFLDENGLFKTYPHRDNIDGFFAALFRRMK